MGMHRKMLRTMFPDDQFGNNMFSSHRGTWNKKCPTLAIWEQCVPFADRNSEQSSPK